MTSKAVLRRRPVLSWAFYDWANSAFATTVMAGFFPVFFKQYWNVGVDATVSTFRLGLANGAASLVIALLAPWLGGQFGLHLQPLAFTVRELGLLLAVLAGGQIAGIVPALLAYRRSLADGLTIRI